MRTLALSLLAALTVQAEIAPWIQFVNLRLVSSTPVNANETDLVFQVSAFNNDTQRAIGVVGSARSTTWNSVVLSQPVLLFPDMDAFGTVTSLNTLTIRQNNAVPFNPAVLRIMFETIPQGCRVGNALVPNNTVNPANPCQICLVAVNGSGWSNVAAGTACSDSNACTTGDVCNGAGACLSSGVKSCDDSDACTVDSCNPVTGACVYTAVNVDDGEICTKDSCDSVVGVIHQPTVTACDDNNKCTVDSCTVGVGCGHQLISCNDNNACTLDTCDPSIGCVFTASDLTVACAADSLAPAGKAACGNAEDRCDLSYAEPSGACVVQGRACAPHPLQYPVALADGAPKLNLCLTLDRQVGGSGCDPASGSCAYRAKSCVSETKGEGICNPDTGGCLYGGVEEPAPLQVAGRLEPTAPAPAPDGCHEWVTDVTGAHLADKCERLTARDPGSVYTCVNDACVARARNKATDACATLTSDPCLVPTVTDGACSYAPRDCGAEFGNDPRFSYACQVDRTGQVPAAVCTRSAKCEINGQWIADGTANPENSCEVCDAAANARGWSAKPELSACFAAAGAGVGQCRTTGVSLLNGFSGMKSLCQ